MTGIPQTPFHTQGSTQAAQRAPKPHHSPKGQLHDLLCQWDPVPRHCRVQSAGARHRARQRAGWKCKQLRSRSNSRYFSREIGSFWDIFVSFRNKVWSGGKRRDVKTNNALCMAVFQSKILLWVRRVLGGKSLFSCQACCLFTYDMI